MMRAFFGVLLLVASLTAQQSWVVDHTPGAVADFTDIPPAVAAAAPGDTIHVVFTSNLLPIYTAPTIDKPIHLIGLNGLASASVVGPTFARMTGVLRVVGVAASQHVLVSNFVVQSTGAAAWGLEVSDCAGDVLLDDVHCYWGPTANYSLRILNCANVTLRGCEMYYAGSPFEISGSNVLISTMRLEPGFAALFPYPTSTVALDLLDSTVTVIGSIVRGHPMNGLYQHQPAARLDHSTLRVGPGALVEGGGAGGTWLAYEIVPGAPSVIEQDPRGTIDVIPSTQGTQQPVITEIDATFHSWVVQNRDFAVTVAGPTGGFALLMLGEMIPSTPTLFGELSMYPGTVFAVGLEAMAPPFARTSGSCTARPPPRWPPASCCKR